jgi:hypothetical protein
MASLKKRGECYYLQFYVAGKKQRRLNLDTDSYQIAKEKLRQFESAQARGDELPLATRTPPARILAAYVEHIRTVKPPKSAQNDIYYLRDLFGPCCQALTITSRKISGQAKKRPAKPGQDRRFKAAVLEPQFIEQLTTADISSFITSRMASRGLTQFGVRMPKDRNPASAVERYKEHAPEISFLKLPQINEQLEALADDLKLQAMVAVLIFAGKRHRGHVTKSFLSLRNLKRVRR